MKANVYKKGNLPANALFITIVIALIIGVLCSMLILAAYNKQRVENDIAKVFTLQRNLQSATDIVLSDTSLILGPKEYVVDLFDDGKDSAYVKEDSWGLLSFASVKVEIGNKNMVKTFFIGQQAPPALKVCLYLAEHRTPLSLVGDAQLLGDAYLPKGGLKSAFIDGRGYTSDQFLKGHATNSDDTLPVPNKRLLQSLVNLGDLPSDGNVQEEAILPDTLSQSFRDSTYVIRSKAPIRLYSNCLKGHILVKSDSLIQVNGRTRLENVILVAPSIEIDSGFSGTLQAIATKSIKVGNNCHFSYPSCFVVLKQKKTAEQPSINLGNECSLSGMILTYTFTTDDLARTKVELGQKSIVIGYIYTSGYLYLQGKVQGTVLSDYLSYKTPNTVYLNYLVDATIDRNSLSAYFVGPPIFSNSERNAIMAWLN